MSMSLPLLLLLPILLATDPTLVPFFPLHLSPITLPYHPITQLLTLDGSTHRKKNGGFSSYRLIDNTILRGSAWDLSLLVMYFLLRHILSCRFSVCPITRSFHYFLSVWDIWLFAACPCVSQFSAFSFRFCSSSKQ